MSGPVHVATLLGITPAAGIALAAGSGSSGFDVTSLIGNLITPVVVIVLLLLGKLRTESEVKGKEAEIVRLSAQLDAERAQLRALQEGLLSQAVPALTRSTLVLERVTPLAERSASALEHVQPMLMALQINPPHRAKADE